MTKKIKPRAIQIKGSNGPLCSTPLPDLGWGASLLSRISDADPSAGSNTPKHTPMAPVNQESNDHCLQLTGGPLLDPGGGAHLGLHLWKSSVEVTGSRRDTIQAATAGSPPSSLPPQLRNSAATGSSRLSSKTENQRSSGLGWGW